MPTLTVNPVVDADDGFENSGSWSSGGVLIGSSGPFYHGGIRFPSVTIPNGATISVATLGLFAQSPVGLGGAGGIYGRATDNAGQFSATVLPSAVARTTATTPISADASGGAKTFTVTSIVQEIINRAGWVSGNAIAIMLIGTSTGTNYTQYNAHDDVANIPSLAITYLSGGTSANLLLLGCG